MPVKLVKLARNFTRGIPKNFSEEIRIFEIVPPFGQEGSISKQFYFCKDWDEPLLIVNKILIQRTINDGINTTSTELNYQPFTTYTIGTSSLTNTQNVPAFSSINTNSSGWTTTPWTSFSTMSSWTTDEEQIRNFFLIRDINNAVFALPYKLLDGIDVLLKESKYAFVEVIRNHPAVTWMNEPEYLQGYFIKAIKISMLDIMKIKRRVSYI